MASNNTNDFYVQLMAALDPTSVNKEFDALKKKLAKDPVIQKVTLDTSMSKQAIKDMATEIHNELGKAFKETGIESFDITVKDVESILASAVKESNKLAKELDTASSKAQKFLAQFNNKSGGTLVNSKEFKAVQDAISGLGKTHSIDDLNKAMNTLETTYNNMVSSLRNSGKSLNPFINAKNEMATMDDTIKGIGLEFEKLANKPKAVSDAIKQLSVQQANVNSHTIGTQEWADAYGKLQQMIQKVKSEISNLQKAQSAKVAVQIFDPAELDKQGRIYVKKVNNTIEKTKSEIESKLRNDNKNRWTDIQITGIEKANGQIKSLTVQATNAAGAFKELRFEAQKIETNSKKGYQTGLVQTSEVKTLKGNMSQMRQTVQSTLDGLKSKWQEQGVLVGEFKTKVEQLQTSLASVGSKGELNNLKSQMESLKTQASQIAEVNKIQLSFDDGTYEAKYDSLIAKTRQWINANDESVISTQRLTTAYNEFNQAATAYAKDGSVANRDKLIQKEEELARQIKATTNEVKSYNAEYAKSSKIDSLHQKIQEFYDKNTATHRKWGAQLKNMLNETAHGAQLTATRVNEIEQEFLGVGNAARQAGKLGDSFFGGIKKQAGQFLQWFSVTSVIMEGVQQVRKMVNEVKTLDNAMMDLTMATGYNKSQIEDLMDTYFKLGDKLSATASDVAASADTWLRQGKSIAETNKLIEDSMVLSKIGWLSSEDSTKYLTSVMKGYKVATEDVIGVVDKLSAVDMASATDVGGLAEGMSEVAASADLAGVSMDKLLGYLATIGEVTQSGMSEVGTTLNAVFARMGNIKLSRLKDYETGEDLSNVETVLRGVGINLRDSMNSFRDFDEVLDETASNWNNYSEVQQRAIAQAFSGTHHMNEFIILMENYDTALKYTETSLGSTGQAMEKFEAYEESIAGHTEKFKNAFQDLSNSVIDSGLINFFIDLGTTGIKAVDGLVDALGGLGAIGAIGGGILGAKNIGKVYECTFSNCFEYALHT